MSILCQQNSNNNNHFLADQQMRKLITCSLLNNTSKHQSSIDSPMQLKLINYLGMKKYMMDTFIFRRKQSGYMIGKKDNKNVLFTNEQYLPPNGYTVETKILQTSSHSIPICKLTPKSKTCNNVIIYAHGNSSDMSDSLKFIEGLSEHIHAEYIVFDYTGYGQSRVPDVGEQVISKDLQIILSWVTQTTELSNIILWGFSLGTYPVVSVASKYDVGGVILQCPIASISCIFYQQLHTSMKFQGDHFANIQLITKINTKILILHSSNDEIIPISHAKVLFDKYTEHNGEQNINFIQVSKIGHNSLHRYIVSPISNQLQSEVFHFILEIMWHKQKTKHSLLSSLRKNRTMKTQKSNKIKSNSKNSKLLTSLRLQSKIDENDSSSTCQSSDQVKRLQQIRMTILEADLQQISDDLHQIVLDQRSGEFIQETNNGKVLFNGCLCPSSHNERS